MRKPRCFCLLALIVLSLSTDAAAQLVPADPFGPAPSSYRPRERRQPLAKDDGVPLPKIEVDAATQQKIERAIEDLQSESDIVAAEAAAAVKQWGHRARPALEAAGKSDNEILAARARATLAEILDSTHVILDGTGQRIAGGELQLFSHNRHEGLVLTLTPDEVGHIALPEPQRFEGYGFGARFSHPDYGVAEGMLRLESEARRLILPLVKKDSAAAERAVRGVVVDADGKPVANVKVDCRIQSWGTYSNALTDDAGRFRSYIQPSDPEPSTREFAYPELYPAGQKFRLELTPPVESDLFGERLAASNTDELRIVLQRPAKSYQLRFERRGGGYLDPAEIAKVKLVRQTDRGSVAVEEHHRLAGRLIPGKYQTSYENLTYLPLDVTADSPEELVFRRPPTITYSGRVVDGLTGKPWAGAFVMAYSSLSHNNLALLSDDEWDALEQLPERTLKGAPGLEALRRLYGVELLLRTDEDGRFQHTYEPEDQVYGYLVFARNRLPVRQIRQTQEPPDVRRRTFDDLPLFPAAKALVRPVLEGQMLQISPEWNINKDGQPKWHALFEATEQATNRDFEYRCWSQVNVPEPVFIPAGLRLRLTLTTNDEQWSPIDPAESLLAEPGETIELPPIEFRRSLQAVVRVTDENGAPVAGVPVRRLIPNRGWSVQQTTDAQGEARLYVAPASAGRFGIIDFTTGLPSDETEKLSVPFDLKQSPDAKYELRLTQEQQQRLQP